MKILFINPPLIISKKLGRPQVFQPMGLAYLAAGLQKKYTVSILDANAEEWKSLRKNKDQYHLGLTLEQIQERVAQVNPDVVGISCQFSINEKTAIAVAQAVKKVNKNIFTILGGPHSTVMPEQVLKNPGVDFIIIGEGEVTILELMQTLEKKEFNKLHLIKGIAYRKNNKVLQTPVREFIQDLDALPFPARELLPMEKYFAATKSGRGPRKDYIPSNRWINVITSRDCPYNCVFCSIHLSMGKLFRSRSPENIVEEIVQAINQYQIKHVNFEDDNISLNKERFEKLCDLIIAKNLNITWSLPNGLRVDNLDEEIVKKMKKSGCYRVFVAPESGVQKVVTEIIKKNLDLKEIEQAVIFFKKYKIIVDGSFVIGFPGETKKDIQNTIKYALKLKKLGMKYAGFHIATPLYGTELYQQAKDKGYLIKDFDADLLSPMEPLIETPDWTTEEIKQLQKLAGWKVCLSFSQKCLVIIKKCFYFLYHPKELVKFSKRIKQYF